MGKRSNFERNPRDYYPTPYEAVIPLLPFLDEGTLFVEPCAGDGRLIDHLERHGHKCIAAYDIEPQRADIIKGDALELMVIGKGEKIITNPAWDRKILHPMIEHFRQLGQTWLLFDADWAHTKQAKPFLKYCDKIVSVGRVKWIEGSKMTGKDNVAWYSFYSHECETKFYNL